MNNELRKNTEGYADPTAAATLARPEGGDIWEYNDGFCLVIKNHGKLSTILRLESLEKHPNNVKVMTTTGPMYADQRLLTYGLHSRMGGYVETVSVEDFDRVIAAVEAVLAIELPRAKTADSDDTPGTAELQDDVNRPAHYTSGGVECIDAIKASMTPEEFRGFLKGNAIKYLWRYRLKGHPEQDLKKADWYLARLTAELEGAGNG